MKSPKKEKGGFQKSNHYKPPQSMRDIKNLLDKLIVKNGKGK